MKNMNKLISTLILICSVLFGYGQNNSNPYPDTLILTTDSQTEIKFLFHRMSNKEEYMSNDMWKSVLSIMRTAAASSSFDKGLEVSYQKIQKENEEEVAKVEVKELMPNSDVFLIGTDGMREIRSNRIEFSILLEKVGIRFWVTDLDDINDLMELNIESVWEQVALKYQNYGKRDLYTGRGVFKYGNANVSAITSKRGGTDSIELSAGIGLGFYRDRFIPDLNFKMAFNIPDRLGNTNKSFGLFYTQQYLFNGNDQSTAKPDINGFLSGFFNIEFLNSTQVGIAAGMLIHRDGDFYQGDTFKFSFFAQKKDSKFDFTPELIFSNDFNQVFPALRFGLTF